MIDEKKLMDEIRAAINDGRYDGYTPEAVLYGVWSMIGEQTRVPTKSGNTSGNTSGSTWHGISIVSGVGIIDSDYRGEIGVPLINWGTEPFTVNDGDRIAQLVVARCEKVEFVVVDELTETERGTGGFGSTGR